MRSGATATFMPRNFIRMSRNFILKDNDCYCQNIRGKNRHYHRRRKKMCYLCACKKVISNMSENLIIADGGKEERYITLMPQVEALVAAEPDMTANMANVAAVISATFGFLWTGFYRVVGDELVLGPFQGPLACTRIGKGRGVCGTAWAESRTITVPDVDQFPGHIACSSLSRSEIVVPLCRDGRIIGVLDIDSADTGTFDDTDVRYLGEIARIIAQR